MSIEPPAAVISRVKGTDGELQTFPGSIIIVGLLQQQQINKLDKRNCSTPSQPNVNLLRYDCTSL